LEHPWIKEMFPMLGLRIPGNRRRKHKCIRREYDTALGMPDGKLTKCGKGRPGLLVGIDLHCARDVEVVGNIRYGHEGRSLRRIGVLLSVLPIVATLAKITGRTESG